MYSNFEFPLLLCTWDLILNWIALQIEKVNIKLNLKKLYQADGHAVQELLKLANLLYRSAKESTEIKNDESSFAASRPSQTQTMNKINEIKNARKIASEITLQGADLFDMLTKEAEIRVTMAKTLWLMDLRIEIEIENFNLKLRD